MYYYPGVTSSLLSIFSCMRLDVVPVAISDVESGTTLLGSYAQYLIATQSYWTEDLSQVCFDGSHLVLALALGIPGLLLFSIGSPLVLVYILRSYRKRIIKGTRDLDQRKEYGLLVAPYR